MDAAALGASLNLNMKCWETDFAAGGPASAIAGGIDAFAKGVSKAVSGGDDSGCGGGYLIVVSETSAGSVSGDGQGGKIIYENESNVAGNLRLFYFLECAPGGKPGLCNFHQSRRSIQTRVEFVD
jgi:hypothetical protein